MALTLGTSDHNKLHDKIKQLQLTHKINKNKIFSILHSIYQAQILKARLPAPQTAAIESYNKENRFIIYKATSTSNIQKSEMHKHKNTSFYADAALGSEALNGNS